MLPRLTERFDVPVVCTRGGEESAAWLRANAPTVAQLDFEVMLEDDSIAAVVVATPVETHAALATQALAAGKHVFVEKPLATSPEDARLVVSRAERAQRVLFVGHILLYEPSFVGLQTAIAGETVEFAQLLWRKFGTFDSDLFWNLGSHQVSLALALMGETPGEVELLATSSAVSECDVATMKLVFSEGRTVIATIDRVSPTLDRTVTIRSGSGALLVWDADGLHELRGDAFVTLPAAGPSALDAELSAFAAAIEQGTPFASDGAHACAVVETVARVRSLLSA